MTGLFHGGVPGLSPGDLILPPAVTGQELHTSSLREATRDYSTRRVYVTTGLDYAQLFAHLRDGAVYEVQPIGAVRPDEDSRVAPSWSCRRARVLRVVVEAPAPVPEAVAPEQRPYLARYKAARP